MAQTHDSGAERCGSLILNKIRQADPAFKQVFSPSACRIGDFDWPRPDYVIQDLETSATYALEYKPPMQSKREYVCGLGQAITYLQHHTYSGLIIPEKSDDGFPISTFLKQVSETIPLTDSPISLFVYNRDFSDIRIIKAISSVRSDFEPHAVESSSKTFWCWWRDMSFCDLFQLLKLSFDYNEHPGDIYSNFIFPEFWNMLVSGQCRDFSGKIRRISDNEKSKSSIKQNYRIPLVQLGLCTNLECRLTKLGFQFLSIALRYGYDSQIFKDSIAYLVLTRGKHLDLINIIDKYQRNFDIPASSSEFRLFLENKLTQAGMIGKRKPTAVTTNAKVSYIRDEFKLWNKFGLLVPCSSKSYFFPEKGLLFDWERITTILTSSVTEM